MRWRIRAQIRGWYRTIPATGTFTSRLDTPPPIPRGSSGCGGSVQTGSHSSLPDDAQEVESQIAQTIESCEAGIVWYVRRRITRRWSRFLSDRGNVRWQSTTQEPGEMSDENVQPPELPVSYRRFCLQRNLGVDSSGVEPRSGAWTVTANTSPTASARLEALRGKIA